MAIREIGHFRARSQSGNIYFIVEYQEFIPAGTFKNPHYEHAGLKSWKTIEGRLVNQTEPETYQIVGTDEIIRKI